MKTLNIILLLSVIVIGYYSYRQSESIVRTKKNIADVRSAIVDVREARAIIDGSTMDWDISQVTYGKDWDKPAVTPKQWLAEHRASVDWTADVVRLTPDANRPYDSSLPMSTIHSVQLDTTAFWQMFITEFDLYKLQCRRPMEYIKYNVETEQASLDTVYIDTMPTLDGFIEFLSERYSK